MPLPPSKARLEYASPAASCPLLSRSAAACPAVSREGDKANQLAHGDVAQAQTDDFKQLAKSVHDLRVGQRHAVGQDGIGRIEAGVESLVSEARHYLADDGRHEQVAKGQIDGNHAVGWRTGLMGIGEVAGELDLAEGFLNRTETARVGGSLEDV